MDQKFNRVITESVGSPVNLFFYNCLHWCISFANCVSATGWISLDVLQLLSHMLLEWFTQKLVCNRCHLLHFAHWLLFSLLIFSILTFGCCMLGSVQVHLKYPWFGCGNLFYRVYWNLHCSMDCRNLLFLSVLGLTYQHFMWANSVSVWMEVNVFHARADISLELTTMQASRNAAPWHVHSRRPTSLLSAIIFEKALADITHHDQTRHMPLTTCFVSFFSSPLGAHLSPLNTASPSHLLLSYSPPVSNGFSFCPNLPILLHIPNWFCQSLSGVLGFNQLHNLCPHGMSVPADAAATSWPLKCLSSQLSACWQ